MNTVHYSPDTGFSNLDSLTTKRVNVALDSRCVSVHTVRLPKLNSFKAKQAIPFALEDQLLSDVEGLEFLSFKGFKEDEWQVMVCAKSTLNGIKQALAEHKLELNKLYPDFLGLPEPENDPVYAEMGEGILYRSEKYQGGWLPKALFERSFQNAQLKPLGELTTPVNFISGMSQAELKKWLKPWRSVAVLALIWALFSTTQLWLDNRALSQKIQLVQSQNEAQFKALFPNTQRIVNLQVQAQQNFEQMQQQGQLHQSDFLTVLSQSQTPTKTIKRLTFKDGKLNFGGAK